MDDRERPASLLEMREALLMAHRSSDPAKNYGRPGHHVPDEIKAQILDLCRQGISRNEIHRRLGVGAASISGIVARAGLTFDPTTRSSVPDFIPTCTDTVRGHYCGQPHVTRHGGQACGGHVTADRNTYDPTKPRGKRRKLLDEPRPCTQAPMTGMTRCRIHGAGTATAIAAGQRREAERKMTELARQLIPDADSRTPITNPLERLLELASEADGFRESLRMLANKLGDDIRYRGTGAGAEQLRAEVATYRQALKDTTDLLVSIARLDIEKMLARIESRKVQLTLDAMNHGCDDAGLDDQQKRAVMAGVARHLRSVPRVA